MVQLDLPVAITLVVGIVSALGTSIGILFRALSASYEARIAETKAAAEQRLQDKDERITDLLRIIERQTETAERAVGSQEQLAEVVKRNSATRTGTHR